MLGSWGIQDFQLPAQLLTLLARLPSTHSLLKAEVLKGRDCRLQGFLGDSHSWLGQVLHILGEWECSAVVASRSCRTQECPPLRTYFHSPLGRLPLLTSQDTLE